MHQNKFSMQFHPHPRLSAGEPEEIFCETTKENTASDDVNNTT